MKVYKSYDDFKNDVLNHLGKYNNGKTGLYKNTITGQTYSYRHILDIPSGSSKLKVIQDLLQREKVNPDMFVSPQQYAHHLNSSQVVCYEFFRPMLDDGVGKASVDMNNFLNKILPNLGNVNLTGEFEYVPNPQEGTNFDFFLKGDKNTKIYFEIKYTEDGFGRCKQDQNHKNKYLTIYKGMINNCGCLKREPDFVEFCMNYQLFRNALRVTKTQGSSEYSIFLYPKANTLAEEHFVEFKNTYISGAYSDHVIGIHWEDCDKFMSSFFKDKFFFYI